MKEGTRFIIGVDLGQMQDYAAYLILRENAQYVQDRHSIVKRYDVVGLERARTSYETFVEGLWYVFENPQIKLYGQLIMDLTGVGRAVIEMMRKKKLHPIGVNITGGYEITKTVDGNFNVPKKELITAVTVLLQSYNLHIAPSLPLAAELRKEMENFQVKLSARGHESFEGESGTHDDMVIALALASWWSVYSRPYKDIGITPWIEDEKVAKEYDPYQ